MIDLHFKVLDCEAVKLAATPQVAFKLQVDAAESCKLTEIQSVMLRVQVRIEPTKRSYPVRFEPGLSDLFGDSARWGATMRSFLWTHANVHVPPFVGSTTVSVPIECTYDFNVAATKYFSSLDEGEVPLCFLFSGTCFYQTNQGLQAAQISWEREAGFRLPARIWKAMMNHYYPNCAWLCLEKDVFDRLNEFKARHSLPNWEQAINQLLARAAEPATAGD